MSSCNTCRFIAACLGGEHVNVVGWDGKHRCVAGASCGEADSGLGLGLVCRPMEGQVGTRLVGVWLEAYWGDTDRHVAGWLGVRGINEWHSKMGVWA